MPIRPGNKLGLEFHENELRIFEVKVRGNDFGVGIVGAVPMDIGYLENGVIVAPDQVGERLRNFLDRQRVSTSDVVACFPTINCNARVMNLPRAPEAELRALINGEVEHFGLVRQGGVYDHVRLNAPPQEGIGSSVLFMATEGPVIGAIDRALDVAGLRLVALEPTHIALFRAAYSLATSTENALFLTVSEYRADLGLLNEGKLAVYRSLEFGANDLYSGAPAESMYVGTDLEANNGRINVDAATSLALEVRRSIDYFSRELPDIPRINRILLASNSPSMESLAEWFAENMGIDTEFIRITGNAGLENGAAFSMEDGVRFLAGYGLAIRHSPTLPKDLPRLDLSHHEQMVSELEVSERKTRLAGIALGGFFLASLIALTFGTLTLSGANKRKETAMKDLKRAQDLQKLQIEEAERKLAQFELLRSKGIPVNRLVLAVGRSVPPSTGLTDLKLLPGKMDLGGEARAEDAIIRMSRTLQANRMVSTVSLTSFERVSQEERALGIRFKMAVSTVGFDPIEIPEETPKEAGEVIGDVATNGVQN